MDMEEQVDLKASKAEARAARKKKREMNERLGKSIEAPRMVGYEDESSRFFDDGSGSSEVEGEKHMRVRPEIQTTRSANDARGNQDNTVLDLADDAKDGGGIKRQDMRAKERKAEARAKRQAKRERNAILGKSSEAPRMVGYEDESLRLFCDDPSNRYNSSNGADAQSIRDEDVLPDLVGQGRDAEVKQDIDLIERANFSGQAKRETVLIPSRPAGAAAEGPHSLSYTDFLEFALSQSWNPQNSSLPPASLINPRDYPSTEGTHQLSAPFEDDSATFYRTGNENEFLKPSTPDDSKTGTDEKKFDFCNISKLNSLNEEKKTVGYVVKAAASLPMSLPKRNDSPSREEEAKIYCKEHVRDHGMSDLSVALDDPLSIRDREILTSRNDSAHSEESTNALDVSLCMEDLRPSLDSYQCASANSLVSDISLGFEELNEEASLGSEKKHSKSDTVLSSVMQVPRRISRQATVNKARGHPTALHSSLMTRKKSSRHDSDLRRSLSDHSGGIRLNHSLRLEDEIKKGNAVRRTKRARVARRNDGKLDASMTGSSTSILRALISSDKSGKKKSGAPEADDAISTLRWSSNITPSAPRKGSIDTYAGGDMMRGHTNGSEYNMMGRDNSVDMPLTAIDSYESNIGSSAEMVSDERLRNLKMPFDSSEHSNQVSTNDNKCSINTVPSSEFDIPKSPIAYGDERGNEGDEGEENNPSRSLQDLGGFLGWITFIRYRRRMTTSIKMMDNQFFIPPREEGSYFFESLCYTMNGYGNDFVVWIYEASFYTVLFLFFFFSYGLIFTFAAILVGMESHTGGRCGLDLYETWSNSHPHYELAFELSWTTFTTVGYGLVSPSDDVNCYPIRFACSLFAFMGLLFNSLSAAIFFSKLEQVLTRASVTFSSSVSLQFGNAAGTTRGSKGVYGQFWMKNSSMRSLVSIGTGTSRSNKSITSEDSGRLPLIEEVARESRKVPYPFLEFRIVNDHANYTNRSVRNANVTAMVQLSAVHADDLRRFDKRPSSMGTFREYVSVTSSTFSRDSAMRMPRDSAMKFEGSPMAKPPLKRECLFGSSAPTDLHSTAMVVQESDFEAEKSGGLEGRVYFPLNLEPSTHPRFKTVWYCRHILNAKSPLLKQSVRERIQRNGGWSPQNWRYQDILGCLVHFHCIRITFKGTSAVSNALVFAQKVYTVEDVYVGWQFGKIFYQKESWKWLRFLKPLKHEDNKGICDDENLMLDKRLIHDIIPQDGGGQEPIEG